MKVPKSHFLQLCFWLPPHSVRADLLDNNNFIQNFVKLSVMTAFFCVTCTVFKQKRGRSFAFLWCPGGPFFIAFLDEWPRAVIKAQAQVPSMFQHWAAPAPYVFSTLAKGSPKRSFCLCGHLLCHPSHSVFGCVKLWAKPLASAESTWV